MAGQEPETSASATEDDVLDTPAAGRLVLRGGSLRVAGYVAMAGLSVLLAAVLTRHLGVVRFGLYTTVQSVVGVTAAVTDVGMAAIGVREYAVRRGSERDALMRNLLGLRLALTLAGVPLTTGFALAAGYAHPLVLGALTASLATLPLVVLHTLSIPLHTGLRLGVAAALDLVRHALWVGGSILLAGIGAGVFPLLSVALIANSMLIIPAARLVRGQLPLRPNFDPAAWPPLLRATVTYSVASAVATVYAYAAQILTSLVTSRHESGLFAVSFRVFIATVYVPALLAGAAFPVLARAADTNRDRLAYALGRISYVSLVVGVGAALVLSAGSGFIIAVIAGPAYRGSGPVLSIQAFGLIGSFLAAGWGFALLSLRLHRRLLIANTIALLVSVVLTLILARADGARGAAIATVCGEAALAMGAGIGLGWRQPAYRPRPGSVVKVITAGAVAGVIALVPSMPSLVRAGIAAGSYGLLLLVMRAIPPELRELLPL